MGQEPVWRQGAFGTARKSQICPGPYFRTSNIHINAKERRRSGGCIHGDTVHVTTSFSIFEGFPCKRSFPGPRSYLPFFRLAFRPTCIARFVINLCLALETTTEISSVS